MLHDILLSLSGHPSALFDAGRARFDNVLSPPERGLLASTGRLAELHRRTRDHAAIISTTHSSVVCRAVAAAITSLHLAAFQRKVLDVERQVLARDAAVVGAYDIVPLAGVVAAFAEWTRRMDWLFELSAALLPASGCKHGDGDGACAKRAPDMDVLTSGADVIDRAALRGPHGLPGHPRDG